MVVHGVDPSKYAQVVLETAGIDLGCSIVATLRSFPEKDKFHVRSALGQGLAEAVVIAVRVGEDEPARARIGDRFSLHAGRSFPGRDMKPAVDFQGGGTRFVRARFRNRGIAREPEVLPFERIRRQRDFPPRAIGWQFLPANIHARQP